MAPPTPSLGSPTWSTADTVTAAEPSSHCDRCKALREDPVQAAADIGRPCHGWPKLAQVMANNPCFESFQGFQDLNIKSLLYYQAQLVQLREGLHQLEWKDHQEGGHKPLLSSNLTLMERPAGHEQAEKMEQIRKVLKRYNAALLQYSEINKLREIESFNATSLHTWIRERCDTDINIDGPGAETWGPKFAVAESKPLWKQLGSLVKSIFFEEREKDGTVNLDLLVPRTKKDVDPLTQWIYSHGLPFWHNVYDTYKTAKYRAKKKGKRPSWYFLRLFFGKIEPELPSHTPSAFADGNKRSSSDASSSYSLSLLKKWMTSRRKGPTGSTKEGGEPEERQDNLQDAGEQPSIIPYTLQRMIRFTNFIATLIACLLPIVAIVVLSKAAKLHTQKKVLGFLALFTAIFAAVIMWLTPSATSRKDVFTATAAFSAVLVVFVQNQSPAAG